MAVQLPGADAWAANMKSWYDQTRAAAPQWAESGGVRDTLTAQAKVVGVDPGAIMDAPSGNSPVTGSEGGSGAGNNGTGSGGSGSGTGGTGSGSGAGATGSGSGTGGSGTGTGSGGSGSGTGGSGGPPPINKPGVGTGSGTSSGPSVSKEGYGNFSGTGLNSRPSAEESADFAKRLAKHMKEKYGLTDEQIAGVFANFMIESRFKVNIREGGGQWGGPLSQAGGSGLAQWTGMASNGHDKQRGLLFKEFCEANGVDPNSELANVMFLDHELQGSHKHVLDKLKNAGSAQEAMMIFGQGFEAPTQPHWDVRATFIEASLELIQGKGDSNFKSLTENI